MDDKVKFGDLSVSVRFMIVLGVVGGAWIVFSLLFGFLLAFL